MSGPTRTFLALPLPEDVRRGLARLQAELAPEVPAFRWTKPDQMHLTLAFLGDVADERLGSLGAAVVAAAAAFDPLALAVATLGAFPTAARPRVLWAGLDGPGLAALHDLQRAVAAAARAVGAPPADDRFSPHVTLGRLRPGRGRSPDVRPLVERHAGWSAGAFEAAEVVVYASALAPQGPIYTALARAPLAVRKRLSPP
jgi:2'-5' RNA ligase